MASVDFDLLASRATEPFFYRAPAPPQMSPREYQLAGVEYCLKRRNALIGDAPGLGKTAQAILLSNAIEARRTLIISPASLRLNWRKEIWKWSMIPNVSVYPVLKAGDGVDTSQHFSVVSYDLLRNESILAALLSVKWDHLVLDEAHYLKDPKGNKRTRAICAPDCLPSVVGRITALSGTILPNQPIEAYNICRLLDWNALDRMSLEDFRSTYYDFGSGLVRGPVLRRDVATGQTYTRSELHWSNRVRNVPVNLNDLQYRLRKHLMVRRLKEQVLHELPTKQWHPLPLLSDATIRSAAKHPGWAAAERLYEMDPDAFNGAIPVDGAIATARREMGEAKAPAVVSYIEDLLDGGVEKLVVCAWHHTVLDYLRKKLSHFGLVYMDGRVRDAAKQAAVDRFQSDPTIKIILGQMQPLGLGWTLTAAQDVVFAEFDYVPGNNDQLLDRIHRIGQMGDYVIGHMPIVPGTLEEKIVNASIQKSIHIHEALDA